MHIFYYRALSCFITPSSHLCGDHKLNLYISVLKKGTVLCLTISYYDSLTISYCLLPKPMFFLRFKGTGILNPCQSSPCLNNATCEGMHWKYNCTCMEGFWGRNCEQGELDLARWRSGCLKLWRFMWGKNWKRVNTNQKITCKPRF